MHDLHMQFPSGLCYVMHCMFNLAAIIEGFLFVFCSAQMWWCIGTHL